jgi:hypothetical protein
MINPSSTLSVRAKQRLVSFGARGMSRSGRRARMDNKKGYRGQSRLY